MGTGHEGIAPLMFFVLAVFLLTGFPVAFALAANGLLFAFIGIEMGWLTPALLQALPQRLFGIMANQVLLAIPFFTFMGIVLERSGLAEDLLDTIGQLFGPVRGGLAYAVIFVGALLAATTGVVAASVIAMGLISLPIMMRYGYDKRLATGVICASGTLAQIIPPSLVLIVLADVLGVSVGDMYAGALIPSAMLVGLLVLYVLGVSIFRPKAAPALPPEARTMRGAVLYRHALFVMVPPLVLIFLVLGTIFLGIATPTEGGAMGAVGAVVLAMMRGRLSGKVLREALDSSAKLTTFVMFVLIGSTIFALVFRAVDGDLWVEHLFSLVPGGVWGFLLVVNLIVFILGFFIDFFEIAFILLPLLAPVADKLGIDLIWFGVMIGMNLQTSFLTPPFGFALFYLRSVAPKSISTTEIYRGAVAFIIIQLFALATVMIWPEEVLWMTGDTRRVDPGKVDIEVQTYDPTKEDSSIQDLLGGPGSRGGEQPSKPPADEDPLQRMLREQEKK